MQNSNIKNETIVLFMIACMIIMLELRFIYFKNIFEFICVHVDNLTRLIKFVLFIFRKQKNGQTEKRRSLVSIVQSLIYLKLAHSLRKFQIKITTSIAFKFIGVYDVPMYLLI